MPRIERGQPLAQRTGWFPTFSGTITFLEIVCMLYTIGTALHSAVTLIASYVPPLPLQRPRTNTLMIGIMI
eukprot:2827998-Rhodomonas_salina.1